MEEALFREGWPSPATVAGNARRSPRLGDLQVQRQSESEWLVRDMRFPEGDRRAVVGYIDRLDDGFNAMHVGHGDDGPSWTFFETMAEAIAHYTNFRVSAAEAD